MILRKDLISSTRKEIISIILVAILLIEIVLQHRPSFDTDLILKYKTLEKEPIPISDNIDDTAIYRNVGISELLREADVSIVPVINLDEIYDFDIVGYVNVNTELNVRNEPSTESDIISKLYWMDEVNYSIVDDTWACIKTNGGYGFIALKYLTDTYESYTKLYPVSGDKAKSYMDYRTITSRGSKQYRLQLRASTDQDNGLRMLRDRYMVAIGSYFNCSIGQYIDVVLSDGEILHCIVGDAKQDIHTDSNNLHGLNGDTVEFIVNSTVLKDKTNVIGNISDISDTFDEKVVEIRTYDHIER